MAGYSVLQQGMHINDSAATTQASDCGQDAFQLQHMHMPGKLVQQEKAP